MVLLAVGALCALASNLAWFERATLGAASGAAASAEALADEVAAGATARPELAGLLDLVVVAGHAVYTGTDLLGAGEERNWHLETYQKVDGYAESFVEAMRAGVREAAHNDAALLLFSGGQTRTDAGPLSEGQSYWMVSNAFGWFGEDVVRARSATEEFARDSYENLLFSVCRFHELTGAFPRNITVVSYDFKRRRFEDVHRKAIAFPKARFTFVGTPPAGDVTKAQEGEAKTVDAFGHDPYGCHGDLRKKRHSRDPFSNGVPYHARCAALKGLLAHCGPRQYLGRLPWDA